MPYVIYEKRPYFDEGFKTKKEALKEMENLEIMFPESSFQVVKVN